MFLENIGPTINARSVRAGGMAASPCSIPVGGTASSSTVRRGVATAALCAKMAALSLDPPPSLNSAQLHAKERVLRGESLCVTGPGGTGKTVLLRDVCDELQRLGKVVAVTASTGIAAISIQGTTLHAVLGCGVPCLTSDVLRKPSSLDKKRIVSLDVLVIDEISMVSGEFLDRVDERLRKIRGQLDLPFGGIQLLAIGDFLQLPPVSQVSTRQKSRKGFCPALYLNRGYAFQARVWAELKIDTVRLEEVFRQADAAFIGQLAVLRLGQVRNGCGSDSDVELRRACDELNYNCCVEVSSAETSVQNVAARDTHTTGTVLCCTNREADLENERGMRSLDGPAVAYTAVDSEVPDERSPASYESLERALRSLWRTSLEKQCRAAATIELKQGAHVMLITNLPDGSIPIVVSKDDVLSSPTAATQRGTGELTNQSGAARLVNGSRGVVTHFGSAETLLLPLERLAEQMMQQAESAAAELSQEERDELMLHAQRRCASFDRQKEWIWGKIAQGEDVRVPWVQFSTHEPGCSVPILPVNFSFRTVGLGTNTRWQIPLRPAWAITVHKSQGMSLDRLVFDPKKAFAQGQVYVALSRARSREGLQLTSAVSCARSVLHPALFMIMHGCCIIIISWWPACLSVYTGCRQVSWRYSLNEGDPWLRFLVGGSSTMIFNRMIHRLL